MKNTIFTLLLCMVFGEVYCQVTDHTPIPTPLINSNIIHIQEDGDQKRVFLIREQEVSGRGISRDGENFPIRILTVVDIEDGMFKHEENHILYQRQFPMNKNFTFKLKRKEFGTKDDIITYDQVITKYPELDFMAYLDEENRMVPEEFYATKLVTPSIGVKIKGFSSIKYTTKEVEKTKDTGKKKKKRGLMSKLKDAAIKLDGVQSGIDGSGTGASVVDQIKLDWESSYGSGQDKKNFWQNIKQVSCDFSGKLYAYNGHKTKEDKFSYYKQHEFVVFDQQGNLLNREEINSDIEWEFVDVMYQMNGSPDYTCPTFITVLLKSRRGKEPLDYAVRAFNEDGSLAYQHEFDFEILPDELLYFEDIDGLSTLVFNQWSGNDFIIIQFSKDTKKQWVVSDLPKWFDINFLGFAQDGDRLLSFYQNEREPSSFAMHEIQGDNHKLYEFSSGLRKNRNATLDLMYNSNDKVIVSIKELLNDGLNGIRFPLVHKALFEVGENGLNPISSSTDDNTVLFKQAMEVNKEYYEADSGLYTVEGLIKPNPKDPSKNSVFTVLTHMENE